MKSVEMVEVLGTAPRSMYVYYEKSLSPYLANESANEKQFNCEKFFNKLEGKFLAKKIE